MSEAVPFFFSPTAPATEGQRKSKAGPSPYGLHAIKPGSTHAITVRKPGEPAQVHHVTAKSFDAYPKAKAVVVCLGAGCEGKAWNSEQAMRADHPAPSDMVGRQLRHAWGLWSEQPVGERVADCDGCKRSKDGPCDAHRAGVVGLIAPPEPKSE